MQHLQHVGFGVTVGHLLQVLIVRSAEKRASQQRFAMNQDR